MGCPGIGMAAGRPGLGCGWPGMVLGWVNRATRSGRGGTTGRAAGWPAKDALEAERAAGGGGGGAGDAGVARSGSASEANIFGPSATIDGSGCRGPDRIWPGLGATGTGFA